MSDYSSNSKDPDLKQSPEKKLSNDGVAAVKDSVAALGQDIHDDTVAIANKARAAAQAKIDAANACAGGYADGVKKKLTEKPLQAVAIAFVAGAVFSALFGRR